MPGSIQIETFTYDVENRLVMNRDYYNLFHFQNDYSYDGQGNLAKRRTTIFDQPGLTDQKDIYFDGIYEETNQFCGAPSQVRKLYSAFGRVFAQRSFGNISYLMADHLGSTVGSIDNAGAVSGVTKYWPFGAIRSGGPTTDKAYTGQQKEFVTTLGAYYYKARFYSTMTGTFLSADPLTVDGPNRYAYARGNPINNRDVTGYCVGGLHCDPAKALNIALCSNGAASCGAVFWALGLPYDEARIAAAVRFSQVAALSLEFQVNLWILNSPFQSSNYGELKLGYSDPDYADALLMTLVRGKSVSDIHRIADRRLRSSNKIADEYERICPGGRCADSALNSLDLALIHLAIHTDNPEYFLTVADGALLTADVQRQWDAYLNGEGSLDAGSRPVKWCKSQTSSSL